MIFVTADLHGCHPQELQQLLLRAGFGDGDFLYILGDAIDRGPYSAELIIYLSQQPQMQLLLGNHEALMLACSFLFEEVTEESLDRLSAEQLMLVESWIENGGGSTLSGFRRYLKEDPELVMGVIEYLEDAPLYETLEVNDRSFVLVHAGLGNFDPERSLDEYDPDELLLTRPSLETRYYDDATVIFGHTPVSYLGGEDGKALHTDTWVCIDTGAAMGKTPMLLCLDTMEEFYI